MALGRDAHSQHDGWRSIREGRAGAGHPHPAAGGSTSSQLHCKAPRAQEKLIAVSTRSLETMIPLSPSPAPGAAGRTERGSLLGTQ